MHVCVCVCVCYMCVRIILCVCYIISMQTKSFPVEEGHIISRIPYQIILGEKSSHVPPTTNLSDVVHIWVVFGWSEDELDPLRELKVTQRRVSQVEQDTKHHRNRDMA